MPYRVMVVCTGNICRSPMAEAVLRDRFEATGLGGGVLVDSTGVSNEEAGNPIDPRAARTLRAAGYAVPHHSARQVRPGDLAGRDLVLAMTAVHAARLRALDPAHAHRVRMFRSFDPSAPAGAHDADLDVADPWYGPQSAFDATLAEIEAAADAIVAHVRSAISERSGPDR